MDSHPPTLCAICRRPCDLESSVTDEWGRAVHPDCYQQSISPDVHRHTKYDEVEELLQQAREMREVADRLIKRSDLLIEAYKTLTGQKHPPKDN